MRLIFDNEGELDIFVRALDDSSYCPRQMGLKDIHPCNRMYCYNCWENALKEVSRIDSDIPLKGETNGKEQ